jgi:hypothetical protein
MFSVNRPIDVVVLNDWVTLTKVYAVAIEDLDQPGEIHQGTAEAVDLVNDHNVDALCLDVGQQPLECRALQRRARNAAIIVAIMDKQPAFGFLAGDVGLAGLALRIKRIELKLEALSLDLRV